jgi:hypothetical protein
MWLTREIKERMARVREQAHAAFRIRLRLPPMRMKGPLPADFGELCRIWGLDAADAANLAQFVRRRRREAVLLGVAGVLCAADILWSLRERLLMAGAILAASGVAFVYVITVKLWQAACIREKHYVALRTWWLGQRQRDQ